MASFIFMLALYLHAAQMTRFGLLHFLLMLTLIFSTVINNINVKTAIYQSFYVWQTLIIFNYYKIHIEVCKKYRHRSKVRKGTERTGCRYFFEEQNINTLSGDGEMMLAVLASFAQEESRSIGRLSSREVHRIHRWGRTFDGDGYGLHAENAGPHQGL